MMPLEKQVWRDIPGYEGLYQASNLGNIRSLKRSGSKGLSLGLHKNKGYLQAWLSKNNKVHKFSAHRLIANTFIPNLENKPEVNHKDGNKTNNRVENLEWCTKAENEAHKRGVLGHTSIGEKNANYGHRKAKLYPNEELRNKLCALGVPRYKHNLAELGSLLPENYYTYRFGQYWYGQDVAGNFFEVMKADTEANARCLMLIYLIEQGIIKL